MKRWPTLTRWPLIGAPFLGTVLAAFLTISPGCAVNYLATQGYYQGKLLLGRVPVTEALEKPDLSPELKDQLHLIQEVRTFGEKRLNMSPTENYTTINLHWNQEIHNVSGCRELSFKPHTWWFPIVGTVPYKGFFRKGDAVAEEARLKALGYETALRKVGGYSTLGWFKDPILPHMLTYAEGDLANLVLHELAHATLFIPGKIDFNESFAAFVGDEAALRFLETRHGRDSAVYRETRARYADQDRFNGFMHAQYEALEKIYSSSLSEAEKRRQKAEILEHLPIVYKEVPFESERYRKRKLAGLNNGDLLQYRRYSGARQQFAAVLASQDGDMSRFFAAFKKIERAGGDPFVALDQLAAPVMVENFPRH